MKINFAELKFRPSLFDEETTLPNFYKELAQALWQQQKDVAAGSLALKLFDSPEVEVGDAEKGFIKDALDNFFQWAKRPVLEALGEKAE